MGKILVTGADGFIGSHLVQKLVQEGYPVKALVFYNSTGSIGWLNDLDPAELSEIEIIFGDVRDNSQMSKLMTNIQTVMHLAALISIPYSYLAPRSYVETNVIGTLNILQAARDKGASVIHTSTSEVYGTANYVPMDESHSLIGQSPYSASKIAADQLAYSFFSSFDLPVQIIRPFNTYGPRQSTRAVIPSIINQILNGKKELKLGSLTPTRDFNFVDDTVDGFLKALKNQSVFGEVINLGSGFEISIGQLVELIVEVMGADITVISDSAKIRPESSEVFRLFSSNLKAQKILGWQPEYGGIEGLKRGLEKSIYWYSNPSKNDNTHHNLDFI